MGVFPPQVQACLCANEGQFHEQEKQGSWAYLSLAIRGCSFQLSWNRYIWSYFINDTMLDFFPDPFSYRSQLVFKSIEIIPEPVWNVGTSDASVFIFLSCSWPLSLLCGDYILSDEGRWEAYQYDRSSYFSFDSSLSFERETNIDISSYL